MVTTGDHKGLIAAVVATGDHKGPPNLTQPPSPLRVS